jgi:lysophospholipase L1-like esterase
LDAGIAKALEAGLYRYYGIGTDSALALVGHSHLMLGVDKGVLEEELGVPVSKYTREGVNVADRYQMVQQLLRHNPNLNTVIYGVDAWTFTGEGLSANSHRLFYPFMDDPTIANYIEAKDERLSYWSKKWIKTSRYNEQLIAGAFRGFLGQWDNLKFGTVDTLKLDKALAKGQYRKIDNSPEAIKTFKATLDVLTAEGIKVYLVYVPTIDKLETVQQTRFDETLEVFKSMVSKQVHFINLQEPWSHDYSLFYDPIHLNPKGQALISKALVARLKADL